MAKKATTTKKVVAKTATKSASKITARNTPQSYSDPNDANSETKTRTGMYMDCWMPIDPAKIKANTVIYGDWLVSASILKKGRKPGMYADTWLPAESIKLKQKKG